jgi:hypothetical protein
MNVGIEDFESRPGHPDKQNRKEYLLSQRSLKHQHKERIYGIVALSEPHGRSTSELVNDTGFHRDTVFTLCNELVQEGLLLKSGGKFGKYHLNPRSFENPELNASLLQRHVSRNFYDLGQEDICVGNDFCDKELCKKIIAGNDPSLIHYREGLSFFEFALRMGAIILYELLQAVRYTQKHIQKTKIQLPNSEMGYTMKNEFVFKYLNNVISSSLLVSIFSDLDIVGKRLMPWELIEEAKNDEQVREQQAQLESRPSILELQEGKFEELEDVFKSIFPQLYRDMEKIRIEDIPKEINWRKNSFDEKLRRIEKLEEEDPDHIKCGGDLLPDIRTNLKGKRVQRCFKCLRWIEVRVSISGLARKKKEK